MLSELQKLFKLIWQ